MVFTPRVLTIISIVVGAVAVATLALSVATDAWLFTSETTKMMKANKTLILIAQMGLWKVCTNTERIYSNNMVFTPRVLMLTSIVVGAIAVATLALSVATDAWLFTSETTELFKRNKTILLIAQMGLWKVCTNTDFTSSSPDVLDGVKYCESYGEIDPDLEGGRMEGSQTSFAIMRATRVAAMFPVAALVMITIAVIFGIIGNIRQDIKTLLAAVIFILSGLTLAVGIIFYISAINDEVGHRSKSKNGKIFRYEYGWSFFFAGIAFMIAEITAVVNVTIYMQRNASTDDMVRIIPGLEDKLDSKDDKEEPGGESNPTIIL